MTVSFVNFEAEAYESANKIYNGINKGLLFREAKELTPYQEIQNGETRENGSTIIGIGGGSRCIRLISICLTKCTKPDRITITLENTEQSESEPFFRRKQIRLETNKIGSTTIKSNSQKMLW